MTRKTLISMLVLIAALFLMMCCKEGSQPEKDQDSENRAARPDVQRLVRTSVKISFRGMIAHVFGDAIGEKDRAAVLENADHPVYLSFPEQIDKTKLEYVTGKTAQGPSGGYYLIGPISGFSVRVVGLDANGAFASTMLEPLVPAPSFQDYAPHLKMTITEDELDQTKLKPNLFDATPDQTDWAIFVPLDGGTLEATKACKPSKFDNAANPREFAARVTLTGEVDGYPAIQFLKKNGSWETVKFNSSPVGTVLGVAAIFKTAPNASHFKALWKDRLGPTNIFHDIIFVACDDQGLDPACTNSQWP